MPYTEPLSPFLLHTSSFRRKTYALVATLVQNAKSLVYGPLGHSTLPKQLVDAVAQEKDAVNITPLLELLLLYLTSFSDGKSTWSDAVDVSLLCKHVNKMLRKACYGASAARWGPTFLPFINALPTQYGDDEPFHFHRQMLSSMWQGREATVGPGDALLIVMAVAECSSFLLLRRQQDSANFMEESISKGIADFFLRALGQYLTMGRVSFSEKDAERALGETLARDCCNMEISSEDRSECALFLVRTWFWDEGVRATILDAAGTGVNGRLARFVNNLLRERGRVRQMEARTVQTGRLQPVFREKFHSVLSQYQSTSGSVPDQGAYGFMIACLKYCGARYTFSSTSENPTGEATSSSAMEQFIMNDLLRWIVIHSSSLSTEQTHSPGDNLLKHDFTVLRDCLPTIPSPLRQKALWESILREIVAAKCDLDILAIGITVLLTETGEDSSNREWGDILRSNEIIEKLAIQAGIDSIQQYHDYSLTENGEHSDAESEASDDRGVMKGSFFVQTCVGLNPEVRMMLVGTRVIHQWIYIACPGERGELTDIVEDGNEVSNPLLEMLLSLVVRGNYLTFEQVGRVLMESWREGGRLWYEFSIDLVLGNVVLSVADNAEKATDEGPKLCEEIVSRISNEVKGLLNNVCISSSKDPTEIRSMCQAWSERAWRLLELCESASKTKVMSMTVSSLALTGLADVALWADSNAEENGTSTNCLYLCLMFLLGRIEDPQGRLALMSSCASSVQLGVKMMLSFSGGGFFAAHNMMPSVDRCAEFLSLLGGRSQLPRLQVESWLQETVKVLASDMQCISTENCSKCFRGVLVLSELVGLLYDGIQSMPGGELLPQSIKEGEMLWYTPNKDENEEREKVQVVKVHHDDFPRLYFTIRLQNKSKDNASTERQTVADRLRRQPSPLYANSVSVEEEESHRQDLARLIEEQLIRPFLSPVPFSGHHRAIEVAGECLNIIISQCGLPEKGGLGSTRYEVFKQVSLMDAQIVDALSSSKVNDSVVSTLLSLSSSMGFGRLTPASRSNFRILRFSPENSVASILDSFVDFPEQANNTVGMNTAMLSWMIVAAPTLTEGDLYMRTVTLMYRLGALILERQGVVVQGSDSQSHLSDSLLALRAASDIKRIEQGLNREECGDVEESEMKLFSKLIEAFTTVWESEVGDDLSYIYIRNDEQQCLSRPAWHAPFSSFLDLSLPKPSMAKAAKNFGNKLIGTLYDSSKRWCSFRILNVISTSGEQLHDEDISLSDGTRDRLRDWQDKLQQEEAEELEDDVFVVHRWLPDRLMAELESWAAVSDNGEDRTAMGRMLSWLCFLSFIDGAAAVDVTNRGAFSSYIYNCGAINSIVSTALSYAEIEKERSTKSSSISVEEVLQDENCLEVSNISRLVLFRTVEVLPTLFKDWWTDGCPKSLSTPVSQFVQNKVAPETLRRELVRIKKAENLNEMSVTGSCVSREVAAAYVQDEVSPSVLVILFPAGCIWHSCLKCGFQPFVSVECAIY